MIFRFSFFLSFVLIGFGFASVTVDASDFDFNTSAKQAYVMDFDTGHVLFEKHSTQKMATSSMSKVMTVMAVFDSLKREEIGLSDRFSVSEKAWKKGGSKMFVELNNDILIEDLLRGVIVQSGNDATIVLAEGLAGTEEAFAKRLNKLAARLGMDSSHFVNASGWPDEDHYSTARDLAVMGAALIRDYPEYYSYFAEPEFTYSNIKQQNRNPLLYKDIGADGIKTGHTVIGGYGLVGSGVRDGRRVIFVLNGMDSEKERSQEGVKVLNWGLGKFKNVSLFANGAVVRNVPVVLGRKEEVGAVLSSAPVFTIPKGRDDDIRITLDYTTPLVAPVAAGQNIGTLRVVLDDETLFEGPVVAREAVSTKGFFSHSLEKVKLYVGGSSSAL